MFRLKSLRSAPSSSGIYYAGALRHDARMADNRRRAHRRGFNHARLRNQERTMPELEQKLEYVDGDIEGVVIRPLKFFNDKRGWLVEIFRHDDLVQDRWPTMMYVSSTL